MTRNTWLERVPQGMAFEIWLVLMSGSDKAIIYVNLRIGYKVLSAKKRSLRNICSHMMLEKNLWVAFVMLIPIWMNGISVLSSGGG